MAEYNLTATSALGGYAREFEDVSFAEVTGLAIVSIAVPLNGMSKLKAALKSAYGLLFPAPGQVTVSKNGKVRCLGMSSDQAFLIFDHEGPNAAELVNKKLKGAAYVTLQSDNWAALRISGAHGRAALERICPIDLHYEVFSENRVARTVMEHLGVVIVCEAEDTFLLLSGWSSAGSFLHAVETSIEYTQ